MGLQTMFSPNANFSSLFDTYLPQKIADVKHKAFLDVNESGSEVAAGTCKSLNLVNTKIFHI